MFLIYIYIYISVFFPHILSGVLVFLGHRQNTPTHSPHPRRRHDTHTRHSHHDSHTTAFVPRLSHHGIRTTTVTPRHSHTHTLQKALALHWLVSEHSQWGTAESTESTLAGQDSPLILSVAAVKVYSGGVYVDHSTPLPNALVLRWLVFLCSQWGTAESTESTLAGQDSTLRLPVAAVKVDSGVCNVDHTTPLPNALVLHWLVFEH